ncbi:hypothetical protein GQ53DRAFT_771702 [Thozetella sp. PMI_491]|nr:hypothetical protein GQ53DRAFT_771702 [Thozetella sp. PMI_491]
MRISAVSCLIPLAGLVLAAPAEKRSDEPEITNPIYWVPVDNALKASVAKAKAPKIMAFDAAGLGNTTSNPSSHPGSPLTAEEEQVRVRIIGDDDRVEVDSASYPWSAIGRLSSSGGAICSGALVGPRLVSVARHCIDAPDGTTFTFSPNYRDGPRYGSFGVNIIAWLDVPDYISNNCNRKYDWALLVLDEAIGFNQGWLGSSVWTNLGIEHQAVLNSAAYHGDKFGAGRMYFHGGVTSWKWEFQNCDNYGPLESDTDGTSGSSGSALWVFDGQNRYNLGALSGGTGTFTIHGWGEEYVNVIADLNNQFPN